MDNIINDPSQNHMQSQMQGQNMQQPLQYGQYGQQQQSFTPNGQNHQQYLSPNQYTQSIIRNGSNAGTQNFDSYRQNRFSNHQQVQLQNVIANSPYKSIVPSGSVSMPGAPIYQSVSPQYQGSQFMQGNHQQSFIVDGSLQQQGQVMQSFVQQPLAGSVQVPQQMVDGTQYINAVQVGETTYNVQHQQPITTQIIEKTYEVEKPIYVEKVVQQPIETVVEKQVFFEDEQKISEVQQAIWSTQQLIDQLQNRQPQVQVIENTEQINTLLQENSVLLSELNYLKNRQTVTKVVEKQVPIYTERVVYVDEPVYTDVVRNKNVEHYIEKQVVVEDLQRIALLESQISQFRTQNRVEYIDKPTIEYIDRVVKVPQVQYIDKEV